jgi:DNA polymerase-3 subunit epsilon
VRAPDQRLDTLARVLGIPVPDARSALTEARTVAAVLPRLLAALPEPPRFLTGLRPMPELDVTAAPAARFGELRPGARSWTASMLDGLPRAVVDAPTADAQRYVDALLAALTDDRILGGEGLLLERLAASAGIGSDQVAALHRRILGHLRAGALANSILTTAELRQLKTAASGLGQADFFDDLRPTSPQDLMAARLR